MTLKTIDFTLLDGSSLKLSDLKGNIVLVCNTASLCGFTKQYEELETLYQKFKNQGLEIIATPSDNFGQQEFRTVDEITDFLKKKYPVSFYVTQPVNVKSPPIHPFYQEVKRNFSTLKQPHWNFHKFLLCKQGHFIDWFSTLTSPTSNKVIFAIKDALAK